MPDVILVNERDEVVGFEEKLKTHREGMLHRAFSVFVFNSSGDALLQKRAGTKYHSGGMWSNACCSHPTPGESLEAAAHRRLKEEMGFDCELQELFSFIYRAELEGNLVEHELDHVLVGRFDGEPEPDAGEVEAWEWVRADELRDMMAEHPDRYTYWFRLSFERVCNLLGERSEECPRVAER
jgi:isopentenyl-diphosphate delta-isomerase